MKKIWLGALVLPFLCLWFFLTPETSSNRRPSSPLKRGVEAKGDAAIAKYRLGEALLEKGRIPEAEEAFKTAIGLKPDFTEARFALGVLWARQGTEQYGAALEQFLEVLRLNPRHVDARINLSNLLEQSGDVEAAIIELKGAIPLASEKSNLYVMLGRKQQRAKKYSEAIQSFRHALESTPQFVSAHYGMGLALRSRGDFGGARSEFESVLKIDGQDAYSHYQLGRLLLQQENLSEAAAHLEEAVRIQPAIPEAHAELGSLYKRQNRNGEAKKAYRTAVRLNPKLIKACYGLAQLLQAEGQVEEAKRFFDEVQQSKQNRSESEQASALNAQGVDQMNEGHLDEAQTAFKKALTMDPSLALAAYNLGLVLTRQSKTQAAIEAFRTAVRLRPGFALAHYDLGILLKVAGDPAASEELRKAQLLHKLVPQFSTVSRATSPEDPD